MRTKIPFFAKTALVLAALTSFSPSLHATTAQVTFSGGSGAPLSFSLKAPVTYTVTAAPTNLAPYFVFRNTENLNFAVPISGSITYSVNGGPAQTLVIARSGFSIGELAVEDLFFYGTFIALNVGDVVTLTAGTCTTTGNVAAAAPANGSYTTLIFDGNGVPITEEVLPSGCIDNAWSPTSTINAPSGRSHHTAVWTGTEMIVWGGYANNGSALNTGGRYNPVTDTWTATSTTNAPSARYYQTAVWTGTEMIVWGGSPDAASFDIVGGRYNPVTDTWIATGTTNAPSARYRHTAIWTGSKMIVWGGYNGSYPNTGGRYNPVTDSWTATSTANAPIGRIDYPAVWTGSEMIVWGGGNGMYTNTGGRYNPVTDSWAATSTTNVQLYSVRPTAVWTGFEMIGWGGDPSGFGFRPGTGARYYPASDIWVRTSTTNAVVDRWTHTAVWTGTEMIVWGGSSGPFLDNGGRYNPVLNTWIATRTTLAPSAREFHTAVWTGSQMIVWGGFDGSNRLNTGGRYCADSPEKCEVCHKGTTLTLPCGGLEYRRHIDHGDRPGACPASKKPSDQTDSPDSLGRD
jgi:hypothetical protein